MSDLTWKNSGNLGSLIGGEISEFAVQLSTATYNINYKITEGILPIGLSLNRDGTISGIAAHSTSIGSTVYNFTVAAADIYGVISTATTAAITVNQTTSTEFTTMFSRPYLALEKRREIDQLLNDETIFPVESIYRPLDPNFGIQTGLEMVIDFGIKKLTLAEYYEILDKNFYRRRFLLGSPRSAVAYNQDQSARYEIIYLDVIDRYVNNQGESVGQSFQLNGQTYWPASVANMRSRIKSQTETTESLDPKFTKILQEDQTFRTEYKRFVPLCYVLPGESSRIIRKLRDTGFQFNTVDFEIDRVLVRDSIDNVGAKYLILDRNYPLV
jgi:hypothetical protein